MEDNEFNDKASREMTSFIYSMNHEFRTPLNAILGFGQMLQFNGDLNDNAKDWLQEIMKAGDHMLTLVNNMLDLAKIESEQLRISPEAVLLVNVIEECFSLVGPMADVRNIQLIHDDLNGFAVYAEPARLKQILLNLLSNAIKYNRAGGKVHIAVASASNHYLRISITDTGYGIPADRFGDLFDPFNRLGEELGTIEGTGIGLCIALCITELMGGVFGVESEVGVGSCFWIELPQVV